MVDDYYMRLVSKDDIMGTVRVVIETAPGFSGCENWPGEVLLKKNQYERITMGNEADENGRIAYNVYAFNDILRNTNAKRAKINPKSNLDGKISDDEVIKLVRDSKDDSGEISK